MSKLSTAERYLYRYKADRAKLEELKQRLEYLEQHGDLTVQMLKTEPQIKRIKKGAEDWYISCEGIRAHIKRITQRVNNIKRLRDFMHERARYTPRYAMMADILECVYMGKMQFRDYIDKRGISERTAYRRRNELLLWAKEYLGLQ